MSPFSAATYVKGSAVLDQTIIQLRGSEAQFYVHYWGGADAHYDNPVHRHSFYEICYVASGEGVYIEPYQRVHLRPGVLFCSRPGVQHQIRSSTGLGLFFVAFELDPKRTSATVQEAYAGLAETERIAVPDAEHSLPVTIWRALFTECTYSDALNPDRLRHLAIALLLSFPAAFRDCPGERRTLPARRTSSTLVYQAKLYIRDNLAMPLRPRDIARHLHVSDRHLARVFQEELAVTVTDYIRKERVRRAAVMLSGTPRSIQEIAEATGFPNVHYFTKVFKAEMGIPPGQFRRKLGDD